MPYHISQSGKVVWCKAQTPDSCPRRKSADSQHFATEAEGFTYLEQKYTKDLTPSLVKEDEGKLDKEAEKLGAVAGQEAAKARLKTRKHMFNLYTQEPMRAKITQALNHLNHLHPEITDETERKDFVQGYFTGLDNKKLPANVSRATSEGHKLATQELRARVQDLIIGESITCVQILSGHTQLKRESYFTYKNAFKPGDTVSLGADPDNTMVCDEEQVKKFDEWKEGVNEPRLDYFTNWSNVARFPKLSKQAKVVEYLEPKYLAVSHSVVVYRPPLLKLDNGWSVAVNEKFLKANNVYPFLEKMRFASRHTLED